MYTKLLSVIAIIEIMWGTIFSVFHTDCCYYQSDCNDLF